MTKQELIDQSLAGAIRLIGEPGFAAALMQFLQQCMPFDNFIVIAYEAEQQPKVLFRHTDNPVVYEAIDTEYVTGSYLLDPIYHAHSQGVRGGLHRLFEIAPDRFKQSSYFDIYYQKTTLVDEIAAFAPTDNGGTLTACITVDSTSGHGFSKKGIDNLRRHCAVICTLIERHWAAYNASVTPRDPARSLPNVPVIEQIRHKLKVRKNISLSQRQAEVALLILQGHSTRSISLTLDISINTVKIFRRQLYGKCNISSQAELFAMLMGKLSDEPV